MIKSDAPIKTKKDDLLGRAKFSESLGKALLEWKNEDGIVIGLYGKWGSGKSSVINLAIEYIETETKKKKYSKKDKPIIIRFNPWNFTEQNQLITIFFTELAKAINYYDKGTDAKKVGQQLITYSKFFSVLSLVPGLDPYAKVVGNVEYHNIRYTFDMISFNETAKHEIISELLKAGFKDSHAFALDRNISADYS